MNMELQINRWLKEWEAEHRSILDWWVQNMFDPSQGGFFGRMDGWGVLLPQSQKGVIQHTRLLWGFSHGARILDREKYLPFAERAYQYLIEHFWDQRDGGLFWLLDHQGEMLEDKKQVYAQAFGIYAFCEFYRLTHRPESLEIAKSLYANLEKHSLDSHLGGYFEAFSRDWGSLSDLRLSEQDLNAAKTMNTHLHVLEAYSLLFRVWPDPAVRDSLKNLINLFMDKFVDHPRPHLHLFFDEEWNQLSSHISFGHDIEASWLIWDAVDLLENEALAAKVKPWVIQSVDAVLEKGIDPVWQGLWNEKFEDGWIDTDFHWWPQVEAMLGCINAWQLTGKEHYLVACGHFWEFCQRWLIDSLHGEWHWGINREGEIMRSRDKAGPWKAPYHHCRALGEGRLRLASS